VLRESKRRGKCFFLLRLGVAGVGGGNFANYSEGEGGLVGFSACTNQQPIKDKEERISSQEENR